MKWSQSLSKTVSIKRVFAFFWNMSWLITIHKEILFQIWARGAWSPGRAADARDGPHLASYEEVPGWTGWVLSVHPSVHFSSPKPYHHAHIFFELSSGNSVTCHSRLSPSSADVQRWAISVSNTPAQVAVEIEKRSIWKSQVSHICEPRASWNTDSSPIYEGVNYWKLFPIVLRLPCSSLADTCARP